MNASKVTTLANMMMSKDAEVDIQGLPRPTFRWEEHETLGMGLP
jgi:hypothetical protein